MKKKILLFLSLFFIGLNYIQAKEIVTLSKCVDGDTIRILLDGDEEVHVARILAVDTPETDHPTIDVEYYGKEASEYTCDLVTNAKKIEIEYDENCSKKDLYNRLLVWVFVDGELLQKKLIENGYAKVAYVYDDYKYVNELEKAQEIASAKGIGIWNEEAKSKYNQEFGISEDIQDEEITEENKTKIDTPEYSKMDIIIIVILILIVVFVGDKTITKKAKKKLKKYLK